MQSNKTHRANKIFNIIQSIDSIKLLKKLNLVAQKNNNTQEIFLQVNVTNNKNQKGFSEEEIFTAAEFASSLSNLKTSGIMAIGSNTTNKKKIQADFNKIKKIQKKIQKEINQDCLNLSIGMSQDYVIALQEGATHIRIGSLLFNKE